MCQSIPDRLGSDPDLILGWSGYDRTQALLFSEEDNLKPPLETTGLLVLGGDK